jgi:hypothetical protein
MLDFSNKIWKNRIIKGEYCMKNWKQNNLIGIVAIIALGFCIVACGGGGDGNQTPVVGDFNISGTGTFDYDGTAKIVTISPKPDKSTGAITVYYNGSVTAPIAINTYSVIFDVAEAEGFNAENGLVAGTLEIDGPNAYGIPIIGTADIEITEAHVATIIDAFDDMTNDGAPKQAEYMKNNVDEFRVIPVDAYTSVGMKDGKLIVTVSLVVLEGNYYKEIGGEMYSYAVNQGVVD